LCKTHYRLAFLDMGKGGVKILLGKKEYMKNRKIIALTILIALVGLTACSAPKATTKNVTVTNATTSKATETPTSAEMIEVVSVKGPLAPINPGGPNVEITLKNVTRLPVIALSATLELNQNYSFKFDVSANAPLLQGGTASARQTLIGAGISDTALYAMVVDGALQDGEIFSLNKQVQIKP
jgi:hypothetical protein